MSASQALAQLSAPPRQPLARPEGATVSLRSLREASRRRGDVLGALELYEQLYRLRMPRMRPAVADALRDALWQLRVDIADALDRCEAAERAARWCRDD